jgi:DNA repair exonuclease SbcCD ATPase subunit
MIIFEKIRFKNFLSYGNSWTELNLNGAQDTLIVGENGAGKSTFLDALSYALYMKPFRKVNNPQLVNSINKKHLAVEVEFKVGSNHYKVCRGHAPRYFEVHQNGQMLNQDSHTKDYQKILEQNILKMNYKSFTQIVVLGSRNFVPFMQLSTADRRSVIEDLLDIQIFSTMATLLKDKVSENKNKLQAVDYEINLIEEKIRMEEQYLEQMKQDKGAERAKLEATIKDKQQDIETLQNAVESLQAQVDEAFTEIKDQDKLKKKSDKYLQLETAITQKLDSIKKKKQFFIDNDDCPTCEQSIDEAIKEREINKANTAVSETEEGLAQLESQLSELSSTLLVYRGVQERIDELNTEIQTKQNKQAGINNFLSEVRQHIADLDEAKNDTDQAHPKAEELQEELSVAQLKRVDTRRQQVVLNTATTLLRDTGIKARIIKQYVPVINKLINKYLAAMEFFVDFHLDEDFKETIRSRHRDDFGYASFSEGEKMRIDLALLFTWRAIAKLKNSASTNLLIMDEVFDSSLDASGTDEFLKIIKELTSDTNIIIISHKTDQLLDKFTNIVRFEKYKNFSRIAT